MKRYFGIWAVLAVFAFSCSEPDNPQPAEVDAPVLVSTSPKDGAGGFTETSMSVVFTYDQTIKCPQECQKGVTVSGEGVFVFNERYVPGVRVVPSTKMSDR